MNQFKKAILIQDVAGHQDKPEYIHKLSLTLMGFLVLFCKFATGPSIFNYLQKFSVYFRLLSINGRSFFFTLV